MSDNQIENLLDLAADLPDRKPLEDEAAFKSEWQKYCPNLTPEALAFLTGYIADRLSFLFIAGYQSAVRKTFGINDNRWTVLAVSEDRSPDNPKPGLDFNDDGTISGFKTWVASSDLADNLIVSVGTPGELPFLMINRDRPGLGITRKNEVGFLADMSQGIARFDRVAVSDTDHLHGPQLKLFAKREPLYLYLAFCGFISRRDQNLARNWATGLLAISEGDFSAKADKKTYADIDTAIGEYFSTLPADAFLGNYDKDKGLMTLYSKGIQKRAGNLNS